jgi:hypothetical protein
MMIICSPLITNTTPENAFSIWIPDNRYRGFRNDDNLCPLIPAQAGIQ